MAKGLLRRVVSDTGVSGIKRLRSLFLSRLLRLIVRSELLSSLYYALLSNAFGREHRGVISGLLKYGEEPRTVQETQYLLRRNIHGLEKGLLMKPRRDVFAVGYIEETVRRYEQAVLAIGMDIAASSELKWAHDVLTRYFEVVASHPVIDKARSRFLSVKPAFQCEISCVPYKRDLNRPPSVSYEDLLALADRRRSVRWYLQKPVPRELIDKAISVASLSPSACNRQPFEFRVLDDPGLVQQVASLPMGTKGFRDNIPVIVVVVGELRAYFSERDRHVIYIDGALASMALMYALETLGLSSCALNWPDIGSLEREMSKLLGLEPDERVVMLISVGYPDPDGMVAYSQKKDLKLLRRYNA
jgi:nitroreductase